jgi:hypothetical protein
MASLSLNDSNSELHNLDLNTHAGTCTIVLIFACCDDVICSLHCLMSAGDL